MKRQILALMAAAGMAVALGGMSAAGAAPASSSGAQQWPGNDDYYCFGPDNCWPIAYRHYVYTDETMSELVHFAEDGCNGGPFVTSPWLPAGYTVRERAFVCASSGPYLPFDW